VDRWRGIKTKNEKKISVDSLPLVKNQPTKDSDRDFFYSALSRLYESLNPVAACDPNIRDLQFLTFWSEKLRRSRIGGG
jgi:hypothetical protein